MSAHILIIDDDLELTKLIKKFLENHNFQVSSSPSPIEALKLLEKRIKSFDLIILDIMLPEMDGFQVLRKLRQNSTIPIIMLTARGEVSDRVVGLELGADDYLPKPFEPEELIARIQSVMRRVNSPELMIDTIKSEHLVIDKLKQLVTVNNEEVALSTTEFDALTLFAENAGQVLNRDFLVENLRGISWQSYDRSIDVLVSRLRHKLQIIDPGTDYIKTIHGVGYKFVDRIEK